DISLVATELDGGIQSPDTVIAAPQGRVELSVSPRRTVNAGDEVTVTVKGVGLVNINALSFALPYNATEWEYVSIDAEGMKEMTNLTNDRLHTSGDKVLYPTFVNRGTKPLLDGDSTLMTIVFRAKKRATFSLAPSQIILVGPDGRTVVE
ncbi:MAG: alpha-xylosidase, partial [Paramuribaculum sp.]|nr:alpha-xylosidase [Paramuribaculum sp.]